MDKELNRIMAKQQRAAINAIESDMERRLTRLQDEAFQCGYDSLLPEFRELLTHLHNALDGKMDAVAVRELLIEHGELQA